MSHEFKIPKFVEIFVGESKKESKFKKSASNKYLKRGGVRFKSLGIVKFGSNRENNFTTPECNIIPLIVSTNLVKLSVHEFYANSMNSKRQVSYLNIVSRSSSNLSVSPLDCALNILSCFGKYPNQGKRLPNRVKVSSSVFGV